MAVTLVPCLVALRSEFNQLAPNRDKTSDGWIGDPAHAAGKSDHNPAPDGQVHAIDVDNDLRKPDWTMSRCLGIIIGRHRTGQDDRLQNVIYDRRIWSRSWGWAAREYTGSNPHDKHAHFSARYTAAQESDTRPWGLIKEVQDVSAADVIAALKSAEGRELLARAVWETDGVLTAPEGSAPNPDGTVNSHWIAESFMTSTYAASVSARTYANQALREVQALAARKEVDEVALAAALAPALAAAVLAGLPTGVLTGADVEQAVRNVLLTGAAPRA